ncbi:MAG: phosphate acetyltransferase [Oligoflexales bacterium]|nr:phosphate acetyltransferase [Oligoflexales bacterium]
MQWSSEEKLMENLSKSVNSTIAFPESRDQRIFEGACYLAENAVMKKVFFFLDEKEFDQQFDAWGHGKKSEIRKRVELVPSVFSSLDAETKQTLEDRANRKGKKIDPGVLQSQSESELFQAGVLLKQGAVDSVLAGSVFTTADVIKAGLSTVGLADGVKTLSGSFLLVREGAPLKAMIYADCGVVIDPSAEQLVDIAIESVKTWRHIYGHEAHPYIAFLSFSTKGSAKHPHADKMVEAARMFKDKFPDIPSDGELQFDAAIDHDISRRKAPESDVCGKANIFVFPDLGAGNIAYKITQRLGGYRAYGPILQGLAKPYSDLSRGASTRDIIVSSFINAVRSAS